MSYRDVFISCTHAVNRMQSKKLSDFHLENQYAMCTCILYQIHAYENYAGHKYIYSVCILYIYSRCFHIRMVLFVVVVLWYFNVSNYHSEDESLNTYRI